MSSPCYVFILRYMYIMQTHTNRHRVMRIMMLVEAKLLILVFQGMTSYFHVLSSVYVHDLIS